MMVWCFQEDTSKRTTDKVYIVVLLSSMIYYDGAFKGIQAKDHLSNVDLVALLSRIIYNDSIVLSMVHDQITTFKSVSVVHLSSKIY